MKHGNKQGRRTRKTRRYNGQGATEKGEKLTLLQEHDARKAVIQVPKVHAAHAALVVQVPVHIEGLVGLDLHLADPLAGDGALTRAVITGTARGRGHAARAALVERRVEFVAPWRAIAVAVAVVVAEEEVAARLGAAADAERLVDRGEEVLRQVWGEGDDGVEVIGSVLGVEATEEVAAERPRGSMSASRS